MYFIVCNGRKLQYTLEEKYLKGQHKYYFEFEDLRLMVDTHSLPMTQTNLHTQGCTLICRRPVFEPTKKLEVPKMSSLLLAEVPSVVHQVPKHWSAVDHFQDFELVELESADPEYITVQRQFFSTMSMTEQKFVHVFRVQNPGLWDKYCSAKRAMTPRGQRPEEVDERQLFHGTPTLQAARGICANSFDFRRSGENVGAIHGKGAYFSTTAKYSHSYTRVHTTVRGDSLRFMFLGRILVGQYTLGNASYTKPPERDRLKLYDSCVNNVSNPSIFVIFDLAQSYPEYLIQYTDVSGKKQQSQVPTSASVPSLAQTQPSVSPLSRQSSLKMSTVAPSTVNSNRLSWSNLLSTPSSSFPSSGSSTNISAGITSTLSSVGSPSTATSPSFTTFTGYPHLVTSTGIYSSSTAFPSASTSKKAFSSSTSSGPLPTSSSSGPLPTSTSTGTNPCYFLFKTTPYLYSYRNIPYLYINRTTPYFYIYRNIIYVYIFRITPWYYIFRIGHYFSIFRTTPCCFLFKTIPYLYIYRTTPFFYDRSLLLHLQDLLDHQPSSHVPQYQFSNLLCHQHQSLQCSASHRPSAVVPVQTVSRTAIRPSKIVSHLANKSSALALGQPVSHQSTTSPPVQPVSHQSTTSPSVQPVSHQSTTSPPVQPVSHQSTTSPPVQPRSRSSQLTFAQSVPGRTPQTLTSSPYMGGPSGFLHLSLNDDPTSFAALDTFTNVSLSTWQDQSSSPVTKPRDKDRCVIAYEELRKKILVRNLNQAQSQLTRKVSSSSVSRCSTSTSKEEEDCIVNVFNFLLKQFFGRTKFNTFLTDRGNLLQGLKRPGIIEWFKDNQDRFLLYESEGDVKYVSVYNSRARACRSYHNPSRPDFGNHRCHYFHVCRRYVGGDCVNPRCSLTHDLSSGSNFKVRSDLNLDQLTDDEVLALILCSSPAVCVNHNKSGCKLSDCPDLHVCVTYIFNQCPRGEGCKSGHAIRDSGEHNSYVLKAFGLDELPEDDLRRLVIVKKGNNREDPQDAGVFAVQTTPPRGQEVATVSSIHQAATDVYQAAASGVAEPQIEINFIDYILDLSNWSSVEADDDVDTYEYICEAYTWTGACPKGLNCPHYHSPHRHPYLWLKLEDGHPPSVSVVFEERFCAVDDIFNQVSIAVQRCPDIIHQIPEHWTAVDRFQSFELVELDYDDPKYVDARRQFFSTMNEEKHQVVHIFRVQNPALWDKYCSARRAMTPHGESPEDVKERQLFHGTPTLQAARGICANSFDFRRSGENVGAIHWGKGAYFSTTAEYSHSYTTDQMEASGHHMRLLREQCRRPTIFVIFDLAQSYPEYFIKYTDVPQNKQCKRYPASSLAGSSCTCKPVGSSSICTSTSRSVGSPSTSKSVGSLSSVTPSGFPSTSTSTGSPSSAGSTPTSKSVGSPCTPTSAVSPSTSKPLRPPSSISTAASTSKFIGSASTPQTLGCNSAPSCKESCYTSTIAESFSSFKSVASPSTATSATTGLPSTSAGSTSTKSSSISPSAGSQFLQLQDPRLL
ncbi:uncharacterized protein LOC112557670 [Pomacea canaliculata]|uniref:uncharacterized protein LOC112557670 n=1 Tax=Pomacea canaliculata TaxID=400727 RepID=UPI000D73D827|nr:uncharacterized protein LOC112557670 [Pomacea canaliculata]